MSEDSGLKIGVFKATTEDPLDVDVENEWCSARTSGLCKRRFDEAGTYFFTSGIVKTYGAVKIAFGGRIVVLPKVSSLRTNVKVSVKGILEFELFSEKFSVDYIKTQDYTSIL